MYIVKIKNGDVELTVHGDREKLYSGNVVKAINAIDSFTFSILPSNVGFDQIFEYTTIVSVYNTNRSRYEFTGRVLYAETTMDESGKISKKVTCESVLGYLCDSQQMYINPQNWTAWGLLHHLLECHNSQVEAYKRFEMGKMTAPGIHDLFYLGIQRTNTWDAIKSKLIDKKGCELQYRIEDGVIYLDYLEKIGETKETPIALSVNMKSIAREQDPTAFVTRLIPLGAKLGDNTEERLTIASVNDGSIYIDDETAIALYGIHVGYKEWDDVHVADTLKAKGEAWIKENNKVQVKYSITALDLSLIGLVIDDFDVGNYHPIKNSLLDINDTARIIKKNLNICEEVSSTIEIGDNFKTLDDVYREQTEQIKTIQKEILYEQSVNKEILESLLVKVVESKDVELRPGEYRVFGQVTGLKIELVELDNGNANEYMFEFIPTEAFTGLNITPEVKWPLQPQIIPGKTHQVSILRGIGVMICA